MHQCYGAKSATHRERRIYRAATQSAPGNRSGWGFWDEGMIMAEAQSASADAPIHPSMHGHQAKWPLSDGRRFGPRRFGRSATPHTQLPLTRLIIPGARLRLTRVTSGPAMKSAEAPPRPPPPSRSPLAARAANGAARCCSGQRMTVSVAYHRQICVPNARDTWCNLYQYQDQDHSISMSSDALWDYLCLTSEWPPLPKLLLCQFHPEWVLRKCVSGQCYVLPVAADRFPTLWNCEYSRFCTTSKSSFCSNFNFTKTSNLMC